MNYQNYDDYMRNTLGFSGMNQSMGMPYGSCANMGCTGMCQNPYTNMANSMWQNQSCNLENLYPDSYKVIYPMVVASCRNVTMPIAEDTIERMVCDMIKQFQIQKLVLALQLKLLTEKAQKIGKCQIDHQESHAKIHS